MRGSHWSSIGKKVEKYLMLTLCKLYNVENKYFDYSFFVKKKEKKIDREVDFYLINNNKKYSCEVKLMGKGNPESADAIIARDSQIFIADTLSEQNKNQCDKLGINWVSLHEKEGFRKFEFILMKLKIPYINFQGDLDNTLLSILNKLL